ncbi:hypothetical protein J1605_017077 [Eschrichtius robustus]|uniref:Uncharacterized protein n=1 Tax=Eschrichtius robustus TaxID=9764 RepID=A0AB34I336_ESCRO|nr:hypothetical protein J1605_017077 [Eschrichtius robustus]
MWDLPRPGLEPVSPALAGGFSTTAPPGKPYAYYFTLCNFFFSNMKGNLSARVTEKSMADSTAPFSCSLPSLLKGHKIPFPGMGYLSSFATTYNLCNTIFTVFTFLQEHRIPKSHIPDDIALAQEFTTGDAVTPTEDLTFGNDLPSCARDDFTWTLKPPPQ